MPNFVSFMYFLLNCITDKRIPYANFLCAQDTDKFCAFHVISVEFYNSANEMSRRKHNCTFLALRQEESNTWRSIIKEIRNSSRDKTVCEYQISFYQICIFEFAVKLRVADFIDTKIVMQSLPCWKRLFFVIEKQSREEEMQPIKKNYFSCLVFSPCKENVVSFRWLINYKSVKDKKYYFRETCWKQKLKYWLKLKRTSILSIIDW